ncbi:unnamed protein product [Toxocara canis]|uniref:INVERT_DEFENSINS domain-containing protein n=1 Tax=Toxocara canis TaxID=6265 RepID=A0A183V5V0_TOXCA|nr:unnamed protein product [Toxocara canis]
MNGISIFVLLVALVTVNAVIDFSTCARMDIPGLSKIARGLCITSCKYQNCGTGYCQKRRGRPTCVCSRCRRSLSSVSPSTPLL